MSKIQADEITNLLDNGAPDFPNGLSTDGTNTFMYTPWTSYSPAGLTGGEWGPSTNIRIQYRRLGDSMDIRGEFTTGTTTAAEAQIDLPTGYTIGGTATGAVPVGEYFRDAASGAFGTPMVVLATLNDTFLNIGRQIIDTSGNSTQNVLTPIDADRVGTGERQAFFASIPIAEWS